MLQESPTSCSSHACLALNADFGVLGALPWRQALTSVLAGRAYVVDEYAACARSARASFRLPSVIARRSFAPTEHRTAAFTRHNLFLAYAELVDGRVAWRCALCGGATHDARDLNFEHVLPRSRGGLSNWSNVVLAHHGCNNAKGNRTLAEAGLTLRVRPRAPTNREIATIRLRTAYPHPPIEWRGYIDEAYWTTPLDP
jgi:5-methylcytosine-specific restriction endonuclease McrA